MAIGILLLFKVGSIEQIYLFNKDYLDKAFFLSFNYTDFKSSDGYRMKGQTVVEVQALVKKRVV